MSHRIPDETWTSDALARGDVAPVMQRVVDDPAYLTSRDFVGSTPLLTAVGFSDARLVEFMLSQGADANVEVDDGYTCLLTAVESDDPASIEIVTMLIAAGADIDRPGTNGWTPLHMAAARGHVEKARILLDAGASVDRRTEIDGDQTPLMEAASSGHPEMVRLLLGRGADPTLRETMNDRTPLDLAEQAGNGPNPGVYELLKSMSVPLDPERILAGLDLTPEQLEVIRSSLANFDQAEHYRENVERRARDGDHAQVIRILADSVKRRRPPRRT